MANLTNENGNVCKNTSPLLRTSGLVPAAFNKLDEAGLPWLKIDARHLLLGKFAGSGNIRCSSSHEPFGMARD